MMRYRRVDLQFMGELTPKEEEFCRLVVCERLSKSSAYRKAFKRNDMSPAAASRAASRLSKKQGILDKIDKLRQNADDVSCMTLMERRIGLSNMARTCMESMSVREAVACIQELNRMDKVYDQQPTVNVAVGVQVMTFGDLMHELEGK